VPSKALIKAASVAHTLNNCEEYGITIDGTVKVDFGKVSFVTSTSSVYDI
jgi:pyruvate/2-oxoglutarate dehydrogenase complex dihydrolipoamide dehydrogenase (E3) component